MKRLALAALALLLAGCQTTAYEGDENSPYYRVPAGSRLILHRDITIPAHALAVFLQGGNVLPRAQINQYYPHCKFELRDLSETERTVRPDEFLITRTVQDVSSSLPGEGVKLAGVSIGIGIRIGSGAEQDGGASVQTYATRMDLRSERQPQVFRLTCGQWEYPPNARHVTINEMRKVLGGLFTLQIPPPNTAPGR